MREAPKEEFTIELIEECKTLQEANVREGYWINECGFINTKGADYISGQRAQTQRERRAKNLEKYKAQNKKYNDRRSINIREG